MSTPALQSLTSLGTSGVDDDDGSDDSSSSGLSAQIAQLLATLEQDILNQLSGQSGSAQPDASSSASSPDATADSQGDSGGMQNLLQEIEQLLQQLLDGDQDADGSGDATDSPALQDPAGDAGQTDAAPATSAATPDTGAVSNGQSPEGTTPTVQGMPLQQKETTAADGGDSGNGGTDASGGDTRDVIDQRLSDLGLDKDQRAAVEASAEQESNFEADVNEGGARGAPTSDVAEDNSDGYGAFQLSGAQKEQFLDYCNANGKNPADINAQMDFLEQDSQFTGAIQTLKTDQSNGASLEQMTEDFATGFEKATDMQMGNRVDYAQQLAAQS